MWMLPRCAQIMCNQVTLPGGVRFIFSACGRVVQEVELLTNGENYVCSSVSSFKKLDYASLAGE